MSGRDTHSYAALAFVENFSLKDLAAAYPEARRTPRELRYSLPAGGEVFLYPFGAAVFHDVAPEQRDAEMERLRRARPRLTTQVIREELALREAPDEKAGIVDDVLVIDRLTDARSGIVALTVAQSAAMEYYEKLVDQMFTRTGTLVDRLERNGTVSVRTRPLHRFIGEAISTRSEVFTILSLLDKPDEVWDDPVMDRIYAELRSEFDLADRYTSLELKLRSVQEALELILDVARERRLILLEIAVILLIAAELLLPLLKLL
ncbi:MAG TPA: RMD1 family protein [Polyangiaceae bacterium]|nr:RMD1 family protein [Polyangiaceae bacterium]